MADRIRIGVVGVGSMGALHARVIAARDDTELAWVADPAEDAGRRVAERYGSRWLPVGDPGSVNALVIAAPTELHTALAMPVVDAGIPLLLEKPLAARYEEAEALVARADAAGSVLMCGLLERFNPAVRTAAEIARDPVHVTTARHSPYADRIVTGVAGDLLIHDVDLVLRLFGAPPRRVTGTASVLDARSRHDAEDVVEATLQFADGGIAALSASRLAQRKVRMLMISEIDRSIEVDLLRQDVTVHRHVHSPEFDEQAGYRQQTIIDVPMIRHPGEPLQLQMQHFVDLVRGDADPAIERSGILAPHAVVRDVIGAGPLVASRRQLP